MDYIIVGQGVAGTVLHRKLTQAGMSAMIIDDSHKHASSKVAAGLINPITGRKYVKSWRIEDFLPVAASTYRDLSLLLGQEVYREANIHRALYTIKDENIWHSRKEDPLASQYIREVADTSVYDGRILNTLSYGSLRGGLQVDLPLLLSAYQSYLVQKGQLMSERYDPAALTTHADGVSYRSQAAKGIIFAEGYQARTNPLWQGLTFTPVKGEVLLVDIKGQPFTDVLRHKLFITPLPSGLYWVGSGYEWDFTDDNPTDDGRSKLESQLSDVLSVPYTVEGHIAGIRPSVKNRKPLLGKHAKQPHTYIFNGMGTKGTGLAPFWAEHFVQYLQGKCTLDPDVDIKFRD